MKICAFIVIISFAVVYADDLKRSFAKHFKIDHDKLDDYELAVKNLIRRVIDDAHSIDDFQIQISPDLNDNGLDTFELEMVENNTKLQITANTPVAAAWGFNYYLKYYCNSSVYWSGKNINIDAGPLPIVESVVRITAKDIVRFNQNVCTYSYSYVWWDWSRWEYEIDWMALNGINLVYAHTAAEYPWLKVLSDFGLSSDEIGDYFTGPAYLAWFRMGNLKKFGGPLPYSWHLDQASIQIQTLSRYNELGIRYVLPAFAGFVPDKFKTLYPFKNFTVASDWIGFKCNFSCFLMVDPLDPLFEIVGNAYNSEVVRVFGMSTFFSADVFNELTPNTTDLDYLARINQAVYNSIKSVNPNAIWVMQSWLFNDAYWTNTTVKAFLSGVPIGNLLLLDLFSESRPHYNRFSSYFGHYFVWNFLHNFGGANGIFGNFQNINEGPEQGRSFPNSSMVGIGITMEGINQNEFLYELMLEKSWRSTMNMPQLSHWVRNFTIRRYTRPQSTPVYIDLRSIWYRTISMLYNTNDYQIKQLFTQRPSFDLEPNENIVNLEQFFNAWDDMVNLAELYRNSSLFKYDLVDFSKEALRYIFNDKYVELKNAWTAQDLYDFEKKSNELLDVLNDMEILLASDDHFLLSNWLESAKSKATNLNEVGLYEWNARTQISLWGSNSTNDVFDYACKAWSGLIEDYYIPRWQVFLTEAQKAILEGKKLSPVKLNEKILLNAELPFISSSKVYPSGTTGDSFTIVKKIHSKYRYNLS